MDPVTAIGLIITVVQTAIKAAPVIISSIKDIKEFASDLFQKFTGKALTDEQRKVRLELVDLAGQGVRTQATSGYYTGEQVEYLTQQLERVAKFLCVKN